MNCKGCKFWDSPNGSEEGARDLFGVCKRIPHFEDIFKWSSKDCGDRAATWVVDEPHKDTLAGASDSEHHYAEFMTRAEFGCVMFEGK